MLIIAQDISYTLPSGQVLFQGAGITLEKGSRAAIVGDNGAGKSTLLQLLAGRLPLQQGDVTRRGSIYYVPQHFGQYNQLSVAQALGVHGKVEALRAILAGHTGEHYFEALADDWDIEERCQEALQQRGVAHLTLQQPFAQLSGGEKTRVLLAGIDIFRPNVVLLDEPTNHLDAAARQQLYNWIGATTCTLLTVSHDRQLLQLCNPIWELGPEGIKAYGGNYSFYESKKAEETAALEHRIAHQEKALKEARKQQQVALERKQREQAQARRNRDKGGIPKILLNGRRESGENSLAKIRDVHIDKVAGLQAELEQTSALEQVSRIMKGHFDNAQLHNGKILAQAEGINFAYPGSAPLWPQPLSFTINSGNRLAIAGPNGSGKSTLLRMLTGAAQPTEGKLYRAPASSLLLDQDYSIVDRGSTVLEQAMAFNEVKLEAHMLKTALVRFLFGPDSWDKPCAALSGGETLRLALCSLTLLNNAPDMIILDEPANNLDLRNIKMLAQIFASYKGTLIVVSHDAAFLEEAGVSATLQLA